MYPCARIGYKNGVSDDTDRWEDARVQSSPLLSIGQPCDEEIADCTNCVAWYRQRIRLCCRPLSQSFDNGW